MKYITPLLLCAYQYAYNTCLVVCVVETEENMSGGYKKKKTFVSTRDPPIKTFTFSRYLEISRAVREGTDPDYVKAYGPQRFPTCIVISPKTTESKRKGSSTTYQNYTMYSKEDGKFVSIRITNDIHAAVMATHKIEPYGGGDDDDDAADAGKTEGNAGADGDILGGSGSGSGSGAGGAGYSSSSAGSAVAGDHSSSVVGADGQPLVAKRPDKLKLNCSLVKADYYPQREKDEPELTEEQAAAVERCVNEIWDKHVEPFCQLYRDIECARLNTPQLRAKVGSMGMDNIPQLVQFAIATWPNCPVEVVKPNGETKMSKVNIGFSFWTADDTNKFNPVKPELYIPGQNYGIGATLFCNKSSYAKWRLATLGESMTDLERAEAEALAAMDSEDDVICNPGVVGYGSMVIPDTFDVDCAVTSGFGPSSRIMLKRASVTLAAPSNRKQTRHVPLAKDTASKFDLHRQVLGKRGRVDVDEDLFSGPSGGYHHHQQQGEEESQQQLQHHHRHPLAMVGDDDE